MPRKHKQVVVFKTAAGFGDRLRALTQCIGYCVKYDAELCVDWDDDLVWNIPFEDIFDLKGIKLVKKHVVLYRMKCGAKVNPPCWTIKDLMTPVWIRPDIFDKKYMGILEEPKIKRMSGDILITNGVGVFLFIEDIILRHLHLKQSVCDEIIPYLEKLNPEHIVVHLRGTDKASSKDYDTMKRQFGEYTKDTTDVACIMTDSKELADDWMSEFPKSVLYRPESSAFKIPKLFGDDGKPRGSHLLFPHELKQYGITKRMIAIETIIDFMATSFALSSMGRKESLFYDTARMMGFSKSNQIFMNGWKPFWVPPALPVNPICNPNEWVPSGGKNSSPSVPTASPTSQHQHPQDAQCGPPKEQQEQHPECPAP